MGPRPFGRGRGYAGARRTGVRSLQWGRDLSVAEGLAGNRKTRTKARLQWGRDLSVAEGLRAADIAEGYKALQWGRDLSVAEGLRRGRRTT